MSEDKYFLVWGIAGHLPRDFEVCTTKTPQEAADLWWNRYARLAEWRHVCVQELQAEPYSVQLDEAVTSFKPSFMLVEGK